ncbi:hypothetical protein ABKN59_004253 [Abortiporus biennis]
MISILVPDFSRLSDRILSCAVDDIIAFRNYLSWERPTWHLFTALEADIHQDDTSPFSLFTPQSPQSRSSPPSWQKAGIDDVWAIFAALCIIVQVIGAWLLAAHNLQNHVRMAGYYMAMSGYTSVLWSARISMLSSAIRIIPDTMKLQVFARCCRYLFLLLWFVFLAQKIYICETNTTWKSTENMQCDLGISVGIIEISSDVLATTALTCIPLWLSYAVRLPQPYRCFITALVVANNLNIVTAVIHDHFVFSHGSDGAALTAYIQASVSIVICSTPVILIYLRRLLYNPPDEDDSESQRDLRHRNCGSQTENFTQLSTCVIAYEGKWGQSEAVDGENTEVDDSPSLNPGSEQVHSDNVA